MDRKLEIQNRLEALHDREWLNIVDKLTGFVHFKLQGWKLKRGAHSEQNLGVDAVSFYVDGAIEKIWTSQWDWKFEKYTLIEQLKVIIGSMISTNLESYRAKSSKVSIMEDKKLLSIVEKETEEYAEEIYELFKEALDECSKDDDDLQLYVMSLDDCNSFDEIANTTGFDKKKLYSLQKKMTRRVKKYIETIREAVK